MTRKFAVICEAAADFQTATELADRVIVDEVAWLESDAVEYQRSWLNATPAGEPLIWAGLGGAARAAGIRARGHFNGEAGLADAKAARRAILFAQRTIDDLSAVVLIRDQDNEPQRRLGLEQARQEPHPVTIVVGLSVPEREAWVICGFDPECEAEIELLADERQRTGGDPRLHSHKLAAGGPDTAERSPKRVLQSLTRGDRDRERRCWRETPLDTLAGRGRDNGLADYLEEVRARLAPLIGDGR